MESLDPEQHEVLVVLPEEGPMAETLRQQNISVYIVPHLCVIRRRVLKSWQIIPFLLSIIPSVLHLWWMIRRHQVELVHTNTGVIFTSALAARLARVPHVWHLQEIFADFPSFWRYYQHFVLFFSDTIFCASKATAAQFPENPKVQVLYNGLDLQKFTVAPSEIQRARDEYCTHGYDKLVAVLGRISLWKGQEVFLEACKRLRDEGVDSVRFLIVGDVFPGNEYLLENHKAYVEDQGLGQNVMFVDFIENPMPLIAALDIVVVPSTLPDPFPTIVLEAMALGTPVIASNAGGPVEQIEDSVTGLLVPPKDPDSLAGAIKKMVNDPQWSQQLGEMGRKRIETLFSVASMSQQAQDTYHKLLNDGR